MTDRLAAIQARAANCLTYNFGLRAADELAHADVPFLLDLVRSQQAALDIAGAALKIEIGRVKTYKAQLDAVEELCVIAETEVGGGPRRGPALMIHPDAVRAMIAGAQW